ncbi:MAG TPA: peptidoglycan DD-metalloendopeptidase family protein [Gemmatimonadales bacterium]|nr:peptidoglycan DD-metalloendopeptidase family protein [Gemmatimonadales bacterium]
MSSWLSLAAPAIMPVRAQAPPSPGLPPLPDRSGWGVHVLTAARDPGGTIWLGTYGEGILRLPPGAPAWEQIRRDSAPGALSWDFVHALAFGPRGQVWYGTLGNGWGLSLDGGRTWRNWSVAELGPEWQYVVPHGIATRGDTTIVATADGLLVTADDGAHWAALIDSTGPPSRGPADTAIRILASEYVRRFAVDSRGWLASTVRGSQRLRRTAAGWQSQPVGAAPYTSPNALVVGRVVYRGTPCGFRPATDTLPCLRRAPAAAAAPREPRTTWFRRPIDPADNAYIDQTYRYGSTMGGNFQQHQGIEFNNADGTAVLAIGPGTVVYAGRAEQGALTVAIRHDSTLAVAGKRRAVFSAYYHNAALNVKVGKRVAAGERIARVGNTGRVTNDHLHLEVHVAPTDSGRAVVDSLERFPPYTTNPELWIQPLPGTGIVAGRVVDAADRPVPMARVYGLAKSEPRETPYSFAETYGDRAHPHPLYDENFAVSDVPPGTYVVGVDIGGKRVYRRVTVEAGKLTWVILKP